jgi:hypothetical protein
MLIKIQYWIDQFIFKYDKAEIMSIILIVNDNFETIFDPFDQEIDWTQITSKFEIKK